MLLSQKNLCLAGFGALFCACGVGSGGGAQGRDAGEQSGGSGNQPSTSTGSASSEPVDGSTVDPGKLAATGGAPQGTFDGEDACAAKTQGSHITQVNLVIIYDRSGSMGDSYNTDGSLRWANAETRWNPAKEALIEFFKDPGAPEIYVSLKFFPHRGGYEETCKVSNYQKPDVGRTSLSEGPGRLIEVLEGTTPEGGTPTLPALQGSIAYATDLMTKYPGSKSIVVLVTDGEPVVVDSNGDARTDNCPEGNENTVENIAAVAEAAYNRAEDQRIPTYVVGIGEETANLDMIATAGGTELIYISGDDGTETKTKLLDALKAIQVEAIDCEMPIPEPEAGETLDFGKVNVNFVHSDTRGKEALFQNNSCQGAGWHYDNPDAPTKIMLCQSTCDAVQTDVKGTLEVELGCDTRVWLK